MIFKYILVLTIYQYTGANVEADERVVETGLTLEQCADMIRSGITSVDGYNGQVISLEGRPVSFTCEVETQ